MNFVNMQYLWKVNLSYLDNPCKLKELEES